MKPIIISIAAIAMTIFLQPLHASAIESNQKHTAGITGHIINPKTGSHIPYVTIELKGTTIAVFADNAGDQSRAYDSGEEGDHR